MQMDPFQRTLHAHRVSEQRIRRQGGFLPRTRIAGSCSAGRQTPGAQPGSDSLLQPRQHRFGRRRCRRSRKAAQPYGQAHCLRPAQCQKACRAAEHSRQPDCTAAHSSQRMPRCRLRPSACGDQKARFCAAQNRAELFYRTGLCPAEAAFLCQRIPECRRTGKRRLLRQTRLQRAQGPQNDQRPDGSSKK